MADITMRIKPMHVEAKVSIKVPTTRRRFLRLLIRCLLLGGVLSLATGCTPEITIAVTADREMPMTFSVSRSQWWSHPNNLIRAAVVKVSQVDQIEPVLVWHLEPARGTDPNKTGFSQLTLGVIPKGYEQLYPINDIQPFFMEDNLYELVIIGDGLGVVRFRVKDGRIVDLQMVDATEPVNRVK